MTIDPEHGVAAGDVGILDDRDGGTMSEMANPDGNAWVMWQIRVRAVKPLLPHQPD